MAEQASPDDGGLVEDEATAQHTGLEGMRWTSTCGTWVLRDAVGEAKCSMSFVSYVADSGPAEERPVMFVFNGGPGSSSIWLHLGVMGPRRIDFGDGLQAPQPPYSLVDNPDSPLRVTDLVFIDPVGTGFSRPAKGVELSEFHGLTQDAMWVGEFIRTWLTRNGRWSSAKYVAGESYGTTRAAALAKHLGDEQGMALAGVLLISTVISFSTLFPGGGNDLPYVLALPTLTAIAHAHGRTATSAGADLESVVRASEAFALGEYAGALLREHLLSHAERQEIAERLEALTGMSVPFLLRNRLRIPKERFRKQLLREERLVVGHFDGRITSPDVDPGAEAAQDDAALWTVRHPFSALWHHYMRAELGAQTSERYEVLKMGLGNDWSWGPAGTNQYVDVATGLRDAMTRNPELRVFVANGYYDLATPYFAAEWSLEHLGLPEPLRSALTFQRYRAGHMMYTDAGEAAALARDVRDFVSGPMLSAAGTRR